MARRSNKTAHVLGLITTGSKAADEAPETAAPSAAPMETADPVEIMHEEESTPSSIADVNPREEASSPEEGMDADIENTAQIRLEATAPIDTGAEEPSVFADNKNLKRIIAGESKNQRSSVKAPIVEILFNDHDPLSDIIRDQLEAGEAMAEATRKEAKMSEENKVQGTAPSDEQGSDMVITKNPNNDHTYIKDKITNESKELGYKFLNVSEELVRERVVDIMNTVEMCTCDRCIVDTIALAVTNMPSKCIVADKDAVFPLLSYYRSKFATAVQTELMKAAMTIKENPHH